MTGPSMTLADRLQALQSAANRVIDKRTLVGEKPGDGYWVSLREMRYLEEALGDPTRRLAIDATFLTAKSIEIPVRVADWPVVEEAIAEAVKAGSAQGYGHALRHAEKWHHAQETDCGDDACLLSSFRAALSGPSSEEAPAP